MSFYLSANVHDLLPSAAAKFWPSPVRLSVGRRGFSGSTGETIVGLDLDAAQLQTGDDVLPESAEPDVRGNGDGGDDLECGRTYAADQERKPERHLDAPQDLTLRHRW